MAKTCFAVLLISRPSPTENERHPPAKRPSRSKSAPSEPRALRAARATAWLGRLESGRSGVEGRPVSDPLSLCVNNPWVKMVKPME